MKRLLFFYTIILSLNIAGCDFFQTNTPLFNTINERPAKPVLNEIINKDNTNLDWALLELNHVKNAKDYYVYIKNGNNWTKVSNNEIELTGNKTINTIKILNLEPNTQYTVSVTAVNESGRESEKSNEIRIQTKLQTPIFNIEIINHESVKLEWDTVEGADFYAVFYTNNPNITNMPEILKPDIWAINNTIAVIDKIADNGNIPYFFCVQAYSGSSNWDHKTNYSELRFLQGTTAINQPVLFIDESQTTSDSITLYWDAVRGAHSYEIRYYTFPESLYIDKELWFNTESENTRIKIESLNPNTLYVFSVKAHNITGNKSIFSEQTMPHRTRTNSPDEIWADTVSSNSITLKWTDMKAASYVMRYSTLQNMNFITVFSADNTLKLENNLRENTHYQFIISARDLLGIESEGKYFEYYTLLSKPENFVISNSSENSIELSWDAKPGATGYIVEVYNSTMTLIRKTQLGNLIRDTNYTVAGLSPNNEYLFIVKAVNENTIGINSSDHIEGEPSNTITFYTLLTTPQTPAIIWSNSRSIELSWQQVQGADSYKVFYNTTDSFEESFQFTPGYDITGTNCEVTGLYPDTEYYFWVQAFNLDGNFSLPGPSVKGKTIISNINIILDFANPDDPVLTGMPENIVQINKDSYTLTVTTDGSGWHNRYYWYLNGQEMIYATGNTFTIDYTLPIGSYVLTVIATKDNIPYSATVKFKVLSDLQ